MSLEWSTLHPKNSIFFLLCLVFMLWISSSIMRLRAWFSPIALIVSRPNSPNCSMCLMSRSVRRILSDGRILW